MIRVKTLKCKECQSLYPADAVYVCERCFGPLEVTYPEQEHSPAKLRERISAGPHTLWRYSDFLPLDGPPVGALPAGMTPLVNAPRLAKLLGIKAAWVKNDAANPTHSFKDRVTAIALGYAKEAGITDVGCASTGNLANAVAAGSAALGLDCHLFVPTSLERSKLIASAVYGDGLVRVRGDYDAVNRLSSQLADEKGWSFVNINLRPYYAEGSKTIAYEIMEQLGWRLPTRVVAPIASGSLYTKVARGFAEWNELGLVAGDLPAMHGSQPQGCSPVATAFRGGDDVCQPVCSQTSVSSLAIGNPADGASALRVAASTGGTIESVTEEEVCDAIRTLAQTTGIFTEGAGGVTAALALRLAREGSLSHDDELVICITGSGLKTVEMVGGDLSLVEIDPTVSSYEQGVASAV